MILCRVLRRHVIFRGEAMEIKKRKEILQKLDTLSQKESQSHIIEAFKYIEWLEEKASRWERYLNKFDWNWYLVLHRIRKLLERHGYTSEVDEIELFKKYWNGLLSEEDWEKIREETGEGFLGRVVSAYGAPFHEDKEYEPQFFNVILEDHGLKKIHVIKVLRTLSDLGLKEAKELVDAAPHLLFEEMDRWSAEQAKEKLEGVGAIIRLEASY
ncbi:MAG: hypothetical protein GF334_09880 [Candidatus Altiarchaeales archaeon]|nr:hypothetical protein [Candidatus Altiarchaeales archaeon]